jgi:hypothetical protein
VGGWQTEDDRIVAIWEGHEAHRRIQDAVIQDPDSATARAIRSTLPPLFDSTQETPETLMLFEPVGSDTPLRSPRLSVSRCRLLRSRSLGYQPLKRPSPDNRYVRFPEC